MKDLGLPAVFIDVHPQVKASIFGPREISPDLHDQIRRYLSGFRKGRFLSMGEKEKAKNVIKRMVLSEVQAKE